MLGEMSAAGFTRSGVLGMVGGVAIPPAQGTFRAFEAGAQAVRPDVRILETFIGSGCAACHDAHGIASGQGSPMGNTHLINFASDVVFADPATGRLEFRDSGRFSGECFLSCHGRAHSPERYPGDLRQLLPGLPRSR